MLLDMPLVLLVGPGTCLSLVSMRLLGNMDTGLFFHYRQKQFFPVILFERIE